MRAAGAVGLGVGYVADLLLGDPRRGHPVAAFGRLAELVEERSYADRRSAGLRHVLILVGGSGLLGLVGVAAQSRPAAAPVALVAAGTWAVLGGRSLRQRGHDHRRAAGRRRSGGGPGTDPASGAGGTRPSWTAAGAGPGLRRVGRGEHLRRGGRAAVLGGGRRAAGAAGLPGDQHAGRDDRAPLGRATSGYGWAAARLDDVANWLPARLAAGLVAALAAVVGGSRDEALRAAREDSAAHPSPNAGVVEAAFAGALGVRLGGRNVYQGVVEQRGELGRGRSATPERHRPRRPTLRALLRCLGGARGGRPTADRPAADRPQAPMTDPHPGRDRRGADPGDGAQPSRRPVRVVAGRPSVAAGPAGGTGPDRRFRRGRRAGALPRRAADQRGGRRHPPLRRPDLRPSRGGRAPVRLPALAAGTPELGRSSGGRLLGLGGGHRHRCWPPADPYARPVPDHRPADPGGLPALAGP